jgi:C4-dicarboxylate transporter DctM subunit
MILVLGLSFFLIMLIGAPIMTALGLSAAMALQSGDRSLLMVVQMAFQALDSFSLMAVPFFILAGHLMQSGGVARRLVQLANPSPCSRPCCLPPCPGRRPQPLRQLARC